MPQFPLSASRHANFQTRDPVFFWPPNVTALERVALSSPGDLRQSLGEYLNDSVHINFEWDTPRQIGGRTIHTQVMNLSHQHRIIRTYIATIRIASESTYVITTSSNSAAPLPFDINLKFTLLAAGIEKRLAGGKVHNALWRWYSLTAPGVECEVEESFADRAIFANPAAAQYWVNKHIPDVISKLHPSPVPSPRMKPLVV
ncbi:unnamed protein product [Rhizoctonia solani]|uniref:Uncharacterized protein n=1 Tax=Rhizoctonia solani TaxID=456999 RepID=A0A8H2WTY4_9AGAM|nr:unnamed protein product [Rhizoctonia solani]